MKDTSLMQHKKKNKELKMRNLKKKKELKIISIIFQSTEWKDKTNI